MRTIVLLILVSLPFAAFNANATPRKASRTVGEGMRPQKSLKFDGRTIETLRGGKYDSYSHLADAKGASGSRKLYSLPRDFSNRVADEGTEMRYRQ